MKTRLWVSFFVLAIIVLAAVFVWGSANYLIRYTDTPDDLLQELYIGNIDVFAVPAVFAALAITCIVPAITWMLTTGSRQRIIFVPLSGAGTVLTFIAVLKWILENRI